MEQKIVRHIEEDREYELHMIELPDDPGEYFNETIINGLENWVWTGPGTATRKNGLEWAQVAD